MIEAAHQIALIPIALVLLRGWSDTPEPHRWMAGAFAVSWLWDAFNRGLGAGLDTYFLFIPLQVGLAIAAFRPKWLVQVLTVLYALGLAGLMAGPRDIGVTVVSSVAVLWLAFSERTLQWTTALYFGAGSVAYLVMIAVPEEQFMGPWYAYQGCRATAFGAFGIGLWRGA